MKIKNSMQHPKKQYITPFIKIIKIDFAISLALQSTDDPPTFESRNGTNNADHFIYNPMG